MKNLIIGVVVVSTLIAAGVGGTFAGFVDTEVSEDNFVQAGISDLLVNGKNDPDVDAQIQMDHIVPCQSTDFWMDAYNWGECTGGDLYLHIKDVESVEAGRKLHMGVNYVYDGVEPATGVHPKGYRAATGTEPAGANVWTSEPEKISEVGGGYIAQYFIDDDPVDGSCLGEDYASGVSDHLDVKVTVPYTGTSGTELGNPDTGGNGVIDGTEYEDWVTDGNRWVAIDFGQDDNKLSTLECHKVPLGFLDTQALTFIHFDVHLQQLYADEWYDEAGKLWGELGYSDPNGGVDYDGDGDTDGDDFQKACWPTNALQGDKATFSIMFELITD